MQNTCLILLLAFLVSVPFGAARSHAQDGGEITPPSELSPLEAAWQLDSPRPRFRRSTDHPHGVFQAWVTRGYLDHVLVPQLDRNEIKSFCDELSLDEDRCVVANELFDEYEVELRGLIQRAYDMRPFGNFLWQSPDKVRPEGLFALWLEFDAAAANLLDQLVTIVPNEQLEAGRAAIHGVKRRTALNAYRKHLGFNNEPAGDTFDFVAAVLEAATVISGFTVEKLDAPPTRDQLRPGIRELLAQYEEELDPLLPVLIQYYRETLAEQFAGIGRNDWGRIERAWRRDQQRWKQFYALNMRYVALVAEVLMETGAQESEAWRERALAAQFPFVYRNRIGIVWEWVDRQSLTELQRAQIAQAKIAHEARERELRREGVELIVGFRSGVFPEPLTPHWSGDTTASRKIWYWGGHIEVNAHRLHRDLIRILGDEYSEAIRSALNGRDTDRP